MLIFRPRTFALSLLICLCLAQAKSATAPDELSLRPGLIRTLLRQNNWFTYARRVTFDYPRHQLTFEYKDPDSLTQSGPVNK
jgi:hypothetical protein